MSDPSVASEVFLEEVHVLVLLSLGGLTWGSLLEDGVTQADHLGPLAVSLSVERGLREVVVVGVIEVAGHITSLFVI